jgi:hypothetical protein
MYIVLYCINDNITILLVRHNLLPYYRKLITVNLLLTYYRKLIINLLPLTY